MYKRTDVKIFVLSILFCTVANAADVSPQWQITKTQYPTADTVVAGFNVLDFGAKADGKMDCTESFQRALDSMRAAGGGTVFVPQGRYVIKGTLRIPVSVTLRGEWTAPDKDNPGTHGTVLMVYAGRGQPDGQPFMTVDYCAGVKDMSFWYPEQDAKDIVPYPYCLVQKGGNNATFENLTLVNPYKGIRIGPGSNELHYIHNVYGTPLKVGIRYDSTTDIGRLENIHFSPDYWCQSGLANAPTPKADFASWLLANGTAVHMERSDWEYVSYVYIDGYQYGYLITKGARGSSNAQFYGLVIRNCQTAVQIEETNPYGMVFTKCTFDGIDYGFRIGEKFKAAILLSHCQISADHALYSQGTGNFIIQNSKVTSGDIRLTDGVLAMTESQLLDPDTSVSFGSDVKGASLINTTFAGETPRIKSKMSPEKLKLIITPLDWETFPEYDGNKTPTMRPDKDVLYVVTDAIWGANGRDKQDDTQAFKKALDHAAKNGGGIVFVPAGNYILRQSLDVPSGVELRGIHDVPHHTVGGGSILHIYPGTGTDPAITLQERSGLRGLLFNYPEQSILDVKKYPFLIQGRGDDIYVINVSCANAYRFLDLMTNQCNRHYVDYLGGSPLSVGIAVGGSSSQGVIRNMQFNPHYWGRCEKRNSFFRNRPGRGKAGTFQMLWTYQKENLDAMLVGDCRQELLFQNFVYGSLYGIHFTQQDGRGPEDCIVHGHGTDGSKVGAFFEHGAGRIDMINSELVAMSSQDKVAIKLGADFKGTAQLINTMVWGSPSTLAQVDGGQLSLHGLHAFHHGNGIQINRGQVNAFNINYHSPGNHADIAPTAATAKLIGTITNGPLIVNKKQVHNSSNPDQIIVIANVNRQEGMDTERITDIRAQAKSDITSKTTSAQKLADGFKFTEGPAVDKKGNIYFTDIPNNRIHKWSIDGKLSTFMENSGGANGLIFDKVGNLIACLGGTGKLVSIDTKGKITVLAETYQDKPFNSLNDLWIHPNGGIYFSDPRYGNRENLPQDGEHVYYLSADRKTVKRVIDDMVRPNGVLGTADGELLYVADHGANRTYSYKINPDGTLSNKKLFANQSSDGMTLDEKGNVYLTEKTVTIYNTSGKLIETIEVPERPSNVCFGEKNKEILFITAQKSLYFINMKNKF